VGTKVQDRAAALARHRRWRPDDAEGAEQLRRELAETKISEFVAEVVAKSPPLSQEARERIAALLSGGGER
jgi:hypothetical protein